MELHPSPADKARYAAATPFPHIVLESLFAAEVLEEVLAEFPAPGQIDWTRFDNPQEKKLGMSVENKIGEKSRNLLHFLNSAPVLKYLEELTGIEGLIPDPYYYGGGFHQIQPGGYLKIHADFNWHEKLKLHRRINMLVYLNKDWDASYGGQLELWDREMGSAQVKVLPVFGRVVVFNTTDFAFHGHPEPLTCPPDRTRKSIALYYYTTSRPKEELSDSHTTLFMKRTGDARKGDPTAPRVATLRKFIPPILIEAARALRRR